LKPVVVDYQPGEYQPNALDDLAGNNFQILANAIVFAAGVLPPDQIVLEVSPGPGADDVTLAWSACDGGFAVFRSTDPPTVTDAANEIGQTTGRTWLDTPAPGQASYYRVVAP